MSSLLKKLCQCIGLASLILVMNYGDLLGGGADVRMHVPFALGGIVAAQIADILILGLVIFLILVSFKQTRLYSWIKLLFAILVPPYLLERTQALLPFVVKDGLVPVLAVIWAAMLLLLLLKFPRWYRKLLLAGDAAGIFLSFFAMFTMSQLLWVAHWKPGPQQRLATWATTPQPPRNHPLLVWIVFDELSYDQAFQHRAHDLELPHFDALRSESTLFTNVQPAGYKTAKVIPSLLTGQSIDDFRYQFNNRFVVHAAGQQSWHALNGSGTVFRDAQENGWRTAAVGWYNPYCTIYGDAIDHCYWTNLDSIDGMMSQRDSLWRNIYSPLQQVVREFKAPARAGRDACIYDIRQRRKTHLDLEQQTAQLLKTDQADFVFLHIPVPHSPNIWSRINDQYTDKCDSSYLDNLALADRILGAMLQSLQASPRWKDTTVIVQGDHSWRIDLWDLLPSWTDEDDEAANGEFDPRPALLVHQPGQVLPQTNKTPWPLIQVHDVVEQVLKGQPAHY